MRLFAGTFSLAGPIRKASLIDVSADGKAEETGVIGACGWLPGEAYGRHGQCMFGTCCTFEI